MLLTVLEDCCQIPKTRIVTTWDARLGTFPLEAVNAIVVNSPEEERRMFQQMATESDTAWVIAPEFEDLLLSRQQWLEDQNCHPVGLSSKWIEIFGRKTSTSEFLAHHKLPHISTKLLTTDFTHESLPPSFPCILKPDQGAGCLSTFFINRRETFRATLSELDLRERYVIQPFLAGRHFSVAMMITPHHTEIFPLAAQNLEMRHAISYRGGSLFSSSIPRLREFPDFLNQLNKLVSLIGSTHAYLGIDCLLPDPVPNAAPNSPLIVEINPRLTTSYLGYRAATEENLMARFFDPQASSSPILWNNQEIQWLPNGTTD